MKINPNIPQVGMGQIDGVRKNKESDPLEQKDVVQLGSSQETERPLTELLLKHQQTMKDAELEKVLSKKTKLYADTYGQIKNLALQLCAYAGGSMRKDMLDTYGILFTKMEPDTKFTVVVESPRDKADVEKVMKKVNMANPERVKFIEPQGKSLTIWQRDNTLTGYLPDEPDKNLLIGQEMLHNWHGDDMDIPPMIAKEVPNTVFDPERRIRTDGGDGVTNTKEEFRGAFSLFATAEVLQSAGHKNRALMNDVEKYYEKTTGKHVVESSTGGELPFKVAHKDSTESLLGFHKRDAELVPNPDYKPTVTRGANEVPEEQMWTDAAKKLMEEEFGKPVTIMGLDDPNTKDVEGPASDHLDMSLTPIDDENFLLGDPDLAKKILRSMTPEEKKQANARLTELKQNALRESMELVKRGEIKLPNQEESMAKLEKELNTPVDIDKMLNEKVQGDKTYNFDNYKRVLEKKGYKIDRVPHLEPSGITGGTYITKNNSVSERFTRADGTEVRRVFLPFFGIPKVDDYAKGVWQKHGFEVIDVPLGNVATRWGALRCISQWLEKSPKG